MVPKFSSACTRQIYTALWSTQRDLRVKAHWVSSNIDSTQCHRGSVDGRCVPRLPYHTTDLYYIYIAPFLIYFLLTLCHTTMLFPILHCSHFYRATPSDLTPCRHKSTFLLNICLLFLTWESAELSTAEQMA